MLGSSDSSIKGPKIKAF